MRNLSPHKLLLLSHNFLRLYIHNVSLPVIQYRNASATARTADDKKEPPITTQIYKLICLNARSECPEKGITDEKKNEREERTIKLLNSLAPPVALIHIINPLKHNSRRDVREKKGTRTRGREGEGCRWWWCSSGTDGESRVRYDSNNWFIVSGIQFTGQFVSRGFSDRIPE